MKKKIVVMCIAGALVLGATTVVAAELGAGQADQTTKISVNAGANMGNKADICGAKLSNKECILVDDNAVVSCVGNASCPIADELIVCESTNLNCNENNYCNGECDGSGYGNGDCDGSGYGNGDCDGSGYGNGDCDGSGYGYGNGECDGSGYGYENCDVIANNNGYGCDDNYSAGHHRESGHCRD